MNDTLFAQQIEALRPKIVNLFKKRRFNPDDVEELTQDVLYRAWKSRKTHNSAKAPIAHWLMRIATNKANDAHRTKKWRPVEVPTTVMENDSGSEFSIDIENTAEAPNPYQIIHDIDEIRTKFAELDLTPDQETLIRLLVLGYTYQDTAQALGIPVGTVRSRFYRVRRKVPIPYKNRPKNTKTSYAKTRRAA